MRFLSFPRSVGYAGATLAAAVALAATLIAPSAASAQTPAGPQTGTGHQAQPPEICILIFPPPPGCPGGQMPPSPPSQTPDVCIQIYPPPPGCPGSQPPSSPPQVWPSPSQPAVTPAVRPGAEWSTPVGYPITNAPVYRPGDTVVLTFRDGSGSVVPSFSGYRCDQAWFEVLGPGGWVPAAVGPACSAITFAPQAAAGPMAFLPTGQQPGTYRVAMRAVTPAGGQQMIVCDPFVVR